MNNYSLNTPIINPKVYIPGVSEIPFAPIQQPSHTTELDQSYRNMSWLFHKPQNHAIFPVQPKAVKIEKKK